MWHEDRIAELLAGEAGPSLYVSGTVPNQGRLYPRFDEIVLLSAPAEVLLRRIDARTTNRYGKTPEQRELVRATWPRSSHCYAEPARSRSTPRDRSSASSTNSQSSVAKLCLDAQPRFHPRRRDSRVVAERGIRVLETQSRRPLRRPERGSRPQLWCERTGHC